MSHKVKDGIIIDNTLYMMDEKKAGFPVFLRCLQVLAVIAGSCSAVLILRDCFFLPVETSRLLLVLFVFSCLIYALFLYPSYDMVKLAAAALIYFAVIKKYFVQLQNGFYIFENAVLNRAEDYYGMSADKFVARYSTAEEDITLLLILFAIPVIALLSLVIVRSRCLSACNVVLLLPVALSFAFGITPSETNLMMYLLTMVFLTRSYGSGQSFKEQKFMLHRINSRAALVQVMIILLLFHIMKLAIPEDKYNDMEGIEVAKGEIQDFLFNFSWEDVTDKVIEIEWLPNRSTGNGGLNSGKLGRVDRVNYDETEQLRVSVPLKSISEGIYLKGFVGSVYTGDSWEGHSKETKRRYKELQKELLPADFQPVNGSTALLERLTLIGGGNTAGVLPGYLSRNPNKYEFKKGTIEIEYKDANKNHIYAPYLTDFDASDAAKYEYDLYAAPVSKDDSYEFEYYFGLSMKDKLGSSLKSVGTMLGDYSDYEKLYRKFVYETYTKLPEDGLEQLRSEFTREKIGSRVDSLDKAVSYIKDYLQSNAQYTLSPGKLPKDEDFVEYFIYQNKAGYCSHFASAGVLMLRSLGYPARYAEGYAINTSDIMFDNPMGKEKVAFYSDQQNYEENDTQVEVSVKDYCAHAWVEVYVDGCGWFPVEFTPGSGVENTEEVLGEVTDFSEDLRQEEEPEVTPTEALAEPTQAPEEEQKPPATEPPLPDHSKEAGEATVIPPVKEDENLSNAFLMIIVLALAVTAIIWYVLRVIRRRREEDTKDCSRKALMVYKQLEKLLMSCKALPKRSMYLEDHLDYAREHCVHIGKEEFEACMETVKKARFGKNTINERELSEVEYFYEKLEQNILRDASPVKRTLLKLVLSI